MVACETVWAETTAHFVSGDDATATLGRLRVEFSPLETPSAAAAGEGWRAYRQVGARRGRIASDFLVAARALNQADRLLTRDRGFYRRYFSDLPIVDPAA